jgi:DNA-binding CsgD family transcriptional regulator
LGWLLVDGLSTRDLRLLREALDPSIDAGSDALIAQPVLDEILRLIPCDTVSLQVMNYTERTTICQCASVAPDDDHSDLKSMFWAGFWDSMCSHPQRTGDTRVLGADYRPSPGPNGGKVMRDYLILTGTTDELLAPLTTHDADDHRLLLFRSGRTHFSERDVSVLTLVRAHVAELHTRQIRRRSAPIELTSRQLEILKLVADGATNRQIARSLTISEATTRAHLANIYTKLGAANRTQALAAAGLLA